MAKFEIKYEDPETGVKRTEFAEFHDWTGRAECGETGKSVGPILTVTAKEWAEDYAYSLSDKGWYEVTPLNLKR